MGILDNLEAALDHLWDKPKWDDSDLELEKQNPHISD